MASQTTWPALDSEGCRESSTTLHLYTQIIGKVQLALTPTMAGWAQAPLRLTARGLASQLLWTGDRSMSIYLDLTGHELRFELSDGARRVMPLEARSVAEFYGGVTTALGELGVEVTIDPMSVEMPEPVSFATDSSHAGYDQSCAGALFQAWTRIGAVFNEFRSGFRGKQTPVELWWGTFDLSVARYSGRAASPPFDRDTIERVAMDAEQSLVGFWPGDAGSPEPVFFSYIYPKPAGIEAATVLPREARWSPEAGEFIVPYELVRGAPDPARALLDFCESTYVVEAQLAGWDRSMLERRPSVRRAA
jgi:hypothetical protein